MAEIVKESPGMNPKIKERIEQIQQGIVPEGYKKTKVGIIPKTWRVKSLVDISKIIDGDRSSNYPSGKDIKKEGVLFLSTKNIVNGKFNFAEKRFISLDKFKSLNRGILKINDLVITMRGSIGNVAIFNSQKFDTGFINAQMSIIRPISVLSYYLWATLHYHILPRDIKKISSGSAQQQLRKSDLEKLKVSLPTIIEQKKIAETLSIWDRAIKLKETLIKEKEEQFYGVKQNVLMPKKNWKTHLFKNKIVEKNIRTKKNNEYPILTSSRKGIFLQEDYFSKQVASKDNTGYKIIKKNEFTFRTMSDDGVFKFNQLKDIDKGIVSPAYSVFTGVDIDLDFLYYYLNSQSLRREIKKVAQGGTRIALRINQLKELSIKLPSRTEQQKIAKILLNGKRELELLNKELKFLRKQKKGLMQLLLTGMVRVGEVGKLE